MKRVVSIRDYGSIALLTVGLLGCSASAQFTRTAPSPYATVPRSPDDVVVIEKGDTPLQSAVDIGIVKGDSDAHPLGAGEAGRREVLRELRKVAGQQGCSTILVEPPRERLFATSNGTPLFKVYQTAHCLVYPEPKPTPP